MSRLPAITVRPARGRWMVRVAEAYSETGKVLRKFFKTEKEAKAEKNRRDADIRENGRMGQLAPNDKAALALVRDIGLSPAELLEAAQLYKSRPKLEEKAVPFSQLVEVFLDHHRNVLKSGRRHVSSLVSRLGRFTAKHGAILSDSMTPVTLLSYLEGIENPATRRGHHQSLSGLFAFALERGYAAENPLRVPGRIIKPPRVAYKAPAILTPQEAQVILDAAQGPVRAFLALGCFAGIRTAEMIANHKKPVLEWSDIDWKKGEIHVRREVAKKTRKRDNERWVPLNPALRAWLAPLDRKEGPIVDILYRNLSEWMQTLALCAGLPEWPDNAPRHSFASYHLAANKEGVGALAKIMGNSEAVALGHYVRALQQEDGEAWFSIRPTKEPALASGATREKA